MIRSSGIIIISLFICIYGINSSASPLYQQTIKLQPGWNAVFLTVQPDDGDPDTTNDAQPETVFANVNGLQQVWTWFSPNSSVQYIQNTNELGFNDPGWFAYVPETAGAHAKFVTNLYKVLGARPYLIKIDASQQYSEQTLTVTGVPVNRKIRWTPDSYTLTGLAINPNLEEGETPSFADFLGIPFTSNPLIFALNTDGSWAALSKNSAAQAGKAYWVFNDGSFTSSGPLEVDAAALNGINFLDSVANRRLMVTSRAGQSLALSASLSEGFPLFYYAGNNPESGEALWPSASQLAADLNPGEGLSVKLGVDRAQLSEASAGLLTLRGAASEIRIPLYAQPSPEPYGLYVGSVTIRQVSEVNESDALNTTPVASELSFRLLLHYAADGSLSLLKTVYMMAQKGVPHPQSGITPIGETVLVTEESRLADFATLAQAGGVGQGYRLSSPVFDFAEPHKLLNCNSATAPLSGGECSIDLPIAADSATHPMRHQYHPNHDGKLANGQAEAASLANHKREIWPISRQLNFTFNAQISNNLFVPLGQFSGEFSETIHGMHKKPIYLRGDFILERVASIDELNPAAMEVLP